MQKSNPIFHSTPFISQQIYKWPKEIRDLLQTKDETGQGTIGELLSAKRACTNLEHKNHGCLHTKKKKKTLKNLQAIIPD